MKKILVTGATGFIGLHLVKELHNKHFITYSQVRNMEKAKKIGLPGTILLGDITQEKLDQEFVDQLPSDLDVVVHNLGLVHSKNTRDFYAINTEATLRFFKLLKNKYGGRPLKFIFISSLAAFGPKDSNRGNTPNVERPVGDYGSSKLLAEKGLMALNEHFELHMVRPPMVMGPEDTAVLEIFQMVKTGIVLKVGRKGFDRRYSFICVYDLVNYIINQVINVEVQTNSPLQPMIHYPGHPEVVSMKEIVNEIKGNFGMRFVCPVTVPEKFVHLLAVTNKKLQKKKFFNFLPERLTEEKVKELLCKEWSCPESENTFPYQWDLAKTVQVTFENYRQKGLV